MEEDPHLLRPFWEVGLDGTGEVVGVGDSGVDTEHCFFYDPDVEVEPTSNDANGVPRFLSSEARKPHRLLESYYMWADAVD